MEDTASDVVTRELYDQLEQGMTYEQAVEILGGEGDLISTSTAQLEPGFSISALVTEVFEWVNEDGSAMRIMFGHGKIREKSQDNLV